MPKKETASKSKELRELFSENARLKRHIARLEKRLSQHDALIDNFTSHGIDDSDDDELAVEGDTGVIATPSDPNYDSPSSPLSNKAKCPRCKADADKVFLGRVYIICNACSFRGPAEIIEDE